MTGPTLAAQDLVVDYDERRWPQRTSGSKIRALDGVSLHVDPGETLGIVGESGCGKSTLGRTVLGLQRPASGSVRFQGQDLFALGRRELRQVRRRMQIVFQDPYSSLNPRLPVGTSVAEGIEIHRLAPRAEIPARVTRLLGEVGLEADAADRYPHEFSGGQRQRIGIARALAVEPSFLVCDEPVSSLDVSVQAQILNLLGDLQRDRGLAYLFIAHDLAVVRQIAHRIAVMYLGTVVESGPAEQVVSAPQHPYTQALVSAVPRPEDTAPPRRIVLAGDPPSPREIPAGCPFASRCFHPARDARCLTERPALRPAGDTLVACHYSGET
ncbi:MAG: ATP-binding cassette domain-containing protein [Gemmatimonadota bacterium]|nr:ATP-binding cassette domain-containing protein [Gemmatimonadota bacterium]